MSQPPQVGGSTTLSPEARRRRLVLFVLGAAGLVLSVVVLQGAFDAGDRRRALAALDGTPTVTPGAASLAEVLRQRNRGAPARCAAEVLSAVRGITRVTCAVADDPDPYRFVWDDLRRDALRPEDEATRQRLAR